MTSVISPSGMMSNLSSLSEPHDQPHDQPCLRCTMECAKLSIILSLRTESCNYKFLSLCCSSACHCHTQRTSSPCSLRQQARGPSQCTAPSSCPTQRNPEAPPPPTHGCNWGAWEGPVPFEGAGRMYAQEKQGGGSARFSRFR